MKENLSLIENLSVKDRVSLAIERVNGLTRDIAAQMGYQWEVDRFGKYKSEHMINMANESEEIIKKYELDKNEELTQYLPLFKFICQSHDLGRHFHDNDDYVDRNGKFLDHGEISVKLLRENGILNNFLEDEQQLIEYTIKNHSIQEMKKPTNEVEKKAKVFCTVFRDMDKLEVLNKRDYVVAKEIYRLLGIQFELGEFKYEWKNTAQREKYIGIIQKILDKKDQEINDGLGGKLKEIVSEPLQENVGENNVIELFESKKSMPMSVYRESKSYANYLLYLLSYINSIEYQGTINNIKNDEIQKKMDFLKIRMTNEQYDRVKNALIKNFKIETN